MERERDGPGRRETARQSAREHETSCCLCYKQVSRDRPLPMDFDISALDEDSLRKINYEFSEDVLKLPKIMTT